MLISKCNKLFERYRRIIFFFIMIPIVVAFVFTFAPGSRNWGDSGSGGQDVGKMFGENIEREEFMKNMQAADITMFMQWGQFLSQNEQMFDYLVDQTLRRIRALHEVRERGLMKVADEQVIEHVKKQRIFQNENENFDPEMFKRFQEFVLERNGISGADFDDIIRENIAVERLEEEVSSGVYVSSEELRNRFNNENESFKLKYHEFKYQDLLQNENLGVSENEVEEYFQANREDLKLPDEKRIRLVSFAPENFMDEVQASEAEIKNFYEKQKDRLPELKDKSLEDVKDIIEQRLKRSASRNKALQTARDLANEMKQQEEVKDPAGALQAAAEKIDDVEVKDSGFFTSNDKELADVGPYPQLIAAGYRLSEENPFSDVVFARGEYFVLSLLESKPGGTPQELTDGLKNDIKEKLLADKAKEFYEKNVEPFRDEVQAIKDVQDLINDKFADIALMEDKSDEEKQELRSQYSQKVNNYLRPYYVPVQKKIEVAVFPAQEYKQQVKVTDEDVAEYYDENKSEYSKEEVQARQILLRVPADADDEAKAEIRAELENIQKQILEGEDFAKLAQLHSEDYATKNKGGDMGWFEKNKSPIEVSEAAFALEEGQVSDVIVTGSDMRLLKLEDRREGQALEEVQAEIREKLVQQEAEKLAEEAAAQFADKAFEALDKNAEAVPAVEVFKETAQENNVKTQRTGWFRKDRSIPGLGYKMQLAQKAHELNELEPLSEVIENREGNEFYVAVWVDTKEGYLPAFDEEGIAPRVIAHFKRENAKEITQKQAQEKYQEISAQLQQGKSLVEAADDLEFQETSEFTRVKPPQGLPNGREVVEAVSDVTANTLVEPIETYSGAMLVYLDSRQLPSDEDFQEKQEEFREQLVQQKEQEALRDFYARLEEKSETEIFDERGLRGRR